MNVQKHKIIFLQFPLKTNENIFCRETNQGGETKMCVIQIITFVFCYLQAKNTKPQIITAHIKGGGTDSQSIK